jgi:hypothetical protein
MLILVEKQGNIFQEKEPKNAFLFLTIVFLGNLRIF